MPCWRGWRWLVRSTGACIEEGIVEVMRGGGGVGWVWRSDGVPRARCAGSVR